jgi:aminopeptidase YwaD
MIDEIVEKALGGDTLMRDFAAICDTGGRFAGSDSEQAAREYLADRLRATTGTAPTLAPVDYLGWSRGDTALERLDGVGGTFPCVSLVRSPTTPDAGLVAELIDVGRGSEQDFQALSREIEGRIVLVRHEYMFATGTIHRRRKYQWAMDHGAVGFLIACHLPNAGPVTGSSGATPDRGIPAAGISAEMANVLTEGSPATIRLRIDADELPCETANLILDLPGQEPEWVVLSAHIDGHHLAESAIDNATGLAAVLSVAAAMAPNMEHFRRGLRIALFTVEEWALAGSKDYVDNLSDSERTAIKLNINLDSIAGSPNLTALTSEFPKLEAWLLAQAGAHGHSLGAHRPLMANSDHYNFARHGIPATRLVAGFNEPDSQIKYVLTPGDTPDKVAADDLRRATALTAALIAEACRVNKLNLR